MKIPFDLQKAKAGAKVVTRDGNSARIIAYDKLGPAPIVALIKICDSTNSPIHEITGTYTHDGRFNFAIGDTPTSGLDLMIEVQ